MGRRCDVAQASSPLRRSHPRMSSRGVRRCCSRSGARPGGSGWWWRQRSRSRGADRGHRAGSGCSASRGLSVRVVPPPGAATSCRSPSLLSPDRSRPIARGVHHAGCRQSSSPRHPHCGCSTVRGLRFRCRTLRAPAPLLVRQPARRLPFGEKSGTLSGKSRPPYFRRNTNVPRLFPTTTSGFLSPLMSPATTCVPMPEASSMRWAV